MVTCNVFEFEFQMDSIIRLIFDSLNYTGRADIIKMIFSDVIFFLVYLLFVYVFR